MNLDIKINDYNNILNAYTYLMNQKYVCEIFLKSMELFLLFEILTLNLLNNKFFKNNNSFFYQNLMHITSLLLSDGSSGFSLKSDSFITSESSFKFFS